MIVFVGVTVGVIVLVGVMVLVGVNVLVGVIVLVGVTVFVGVKVFVGVNVLVGVTVGVRVPVGVLSELLWFVMELQICMTSSKAIYVSHDSLELACNARSFIVDQRVCGYSCFSHS